MKSSKQRLVLSVAMLSLGLSGCQKAAEPAPQATQASSAAQALAGEAAEALKPGPHDKVLTIESSNSDVAVTGVFLDGRPLTTAGLGTASAQALLIADPEEGNGTPCTSEGIEVRMANAVILRPLANFCQTKYRLVVSAAKASLPMPLPAAPDEFSWNIDGRGSDKMIYFGIPETDATAFIATCRKGETRTQVTFYYEAGPTPTLDLYGPDRMLRYGLSRMSPGSSEEAPSNTVDLGVDDQFWSMLGRGTQLTYRIGKSDFLSLDTRQGADKINEFLNWCRGD